MVEPINSQELKEGDILNEISEIIKSKLELIDSLGIKFIISLHKYPLIKANYNQTSQEFWGNKTLVNESINTFIELVKITNFKRNTILGYAYINEPIIRGKYSHRKPSNLRFIQKDVALKLLKLNSNKFLIISPGPGGHANGYSNFTPLLQKNILYNFHFFQPKEYTQFPQKLLYKYDYIGSKKFNKDYILERLKPVLDFKKRYNVPMLLGSFNAHLKAYNRTQYLEDIISICDSLAINHSIHVYNGHPIWETN